MKKTPSEILDEKYRKAFIKVIDRIGGLDKRISTEMASNHLVRCLAQMNLFVWDWEDEKKK